MLLPRILNLTVRDAKGKGQPGISCDSSGSLQEQGQSTERQRHTEAMVPAVADTRLSLVVPAVCAPVPSFLPSIPTPPPLSDASSPALLLIL